MVENAEFASSKEFQELPSEAEEEKDERKGKKYIPLTKSKS